MRTPEALEEEEVEVGTRVVVEEAEIEEAIVMATRGAMMTTEEAVVGEVEEGTTGAVGIVTEATEGAVIEEEADMTMTISDREPVRMLNCLKGI